MGTVLDARLRADVDRGSPASERLLAERCASSTRCGAFSRGRRNAATPFRCAFRRCRASLPSQCSIVPGASRPRTPPAAIVIRPPRPEIHSRERNETRTGRFAPGSPPIRHGSCKGASRAKQHEPGVWASTVMSVSLRHIRHFTAAIVQLNATLGPHMPDANLRLQTSTTARVAVRIYSESARGADGNFTHPLPLFSICRHPATFARSGR